MLLIILLAALASTAINLDVNAGGKAKEDTEQHWIELGADQGVYNATISDSEQQIPVTKLSFAGDTTLDGVKKESDNSTSRLNLGEVESIQMIDPIYESKRYPQVELCCVAITTTAGVSENMLMPRNLLICGQDRNSKIKKTWALRKIDAIQLEHGLENSQSNPAYYTRNDTQA
ncbi:MAG: hypothetical protein QG632_105 [Candidatus Dependentiae bacterium]|nr:hypothetical protein [Candidatus Dependentiae bacterium]